MTLSSGQLRMWISRDEEGGIYEADYETTLFMIFGDPYENQFGQRMVDLLEDGRVFEYINVEHVEYWSIPLTDSSDS